VPLTTLGGDMGIEDCIVADCLQKLCKRANYVESLAHQTAAVMASPLLSFRLRDQLAHC
jgi:hypothetical protein